ncbi:uncharacterized protein [Dermacentor andersoni]|uniref:uncharacterized protein isoform X2 n=1 Tax=Dermacentor andersoni TaxID=34620 RepID=UPI002417F131|nr:uncharacterized protein LOC126543851 isoform X2 [Dermacentor andersoni]
MRRRVWVFGPRPSVCLQHDPRSCDAAQRDDCGNPRRRSTYLYSHALPFFIASTNLRLDHLSSQLVRRVAGSYHVTQEVE